MALYWRGTATNWSDTTGWSTTDGGGSAGVIPTATDDVNFTANGNGTNCTLDTAVNKVAKTLTINGYTGTLTFNVQLSVSGSITFTTTGFSFAGAHTNRLRMIAAGTWTTNGKAIDQDVEIGGTTTFTCTLAGTLNLNQDFYLTNTTSTIFSGAFDIVGGGACTVSGSQTITLSGNLTCGGLTIADANVINGAFTINAVSLTTTGALTGTVALSLNLGTWSGAAACSCSVTIGSADVILSGTVLYAASGTPTLTLVGNLTGSGTLSIATACTIVGATGKTIPNVTITAALTLTLNTVALGIAGTLTLPNAAVTFAGNVGFTVGTLTNTTITATRITTFTAGNTYTITTALNTVSAAAQTVRFTWISSHATNKVAITLQPGATQDVAFLDPTRIDSSGGQAIFSYHGVITTSFNWSVLLGYGNIIKDLTGAALTIAGVTYDKNGSILGSCDVYLWRDNGNNTATYIAYVLSNASTGAYSFTVFPGSTYFVTAMKAGATPVMDVTDRTLVAV